MPNKKPQSISCLICTGTIEDSFSGIRPNPDSFSRFLNVVSDHKFPGTNDVSEGLMNSEFILLCFACHDKLIELNEMFAKLEEIQSQLTELRNEVRNQLLIPYSSPAPTPAIEENLMVPDVNVDDFGTLRQTIVNHLGVSKTSHVVTINLSQVLPPGVDNVELVIKPEETDDCIINNGVEDEHDPFQIPIPVDRDYEATGDDSDYIPPHSEDEYDDDSDFVPDQVAEQTHSIPSVPNNTNHKLPKLANTIRKCSVYLGQRINEIIPITTSPIVVPKEIINTTLPWSKDRAITQEIYDCTYPHKCPIEGCSSERLFRRDWFKHHIITVHLNKRVPDSKWNLPHALKPEIESFVYPVTCPRVECKTSEPIILFLNPEQFTKHFEEVHFEKYRIPRDKTLSLDLLTQLEQTKIFPASCFVPDCPGLKMGRKYRNFKQLRSHVLDNHRQIPQEQKRRPSPTEQRFLNSISTYPTNCPIANCPNKLQLQTRTDLHSHLRNLHDLWWIIPPKTKPIVDRFPCTYNNCKRIFKRKRGLEEHINFIHKDPNKKKRRSQASKSKNPNPPKPKGSNSNSKIQCHLCGKYLADSANLKVHLSRHDGVPKHFCQVQSCGKGFLLLLNKKNHERSKHWEELGLEPIQCQICNKYFTTKGALSQHTQTHTGNFKYSCDQCDYKTSRVNDLREHKASVHQAECPWSCDNCGKKFKLKRQLKKHTLLQHRSEDELSNCDICGKVFGANHLLRIHKERMHGINTGVVFGSSINGV